jgi:hypothetical protein
VISPVGGQSRLLDDRLTVKPLEARISVSWETYCAVASVGLAGKEETGLEGCVGSQFQFDKGRFRITVVAVNRTAATFAVDQHMSKLKEAVGVLVAARINPSSQPLFDLGVLRIDPGLLGSRHPR